MDWSDPKIVAAGISLGGVIASIVASIIVAILSRRNLRLELKHKFNDHLYQTRLKCYPKLYAAVSDLGKKIRLPVLFYADITDCLRDVNVWDSQYAIFLSQAATKALFNFRFLLESFADRPRGGQATRNELKEILRTALRLELVLKYEIGVYSIGEYHSPSPDIFPSLAPKSKLEKNVELAQSARAGAEMSPPG